MSEFLIIAIVAVSTLVGVLIYLLLGTIRAALPLVGGEEERLPYNLGRVTQGSAREKPSR